MEHTFGDSMTSLAPADLHGKSLSNDTFFHFYTDALFLSSLVRRPPSTVLARRRPHSPHIVHCLTHMSHTEPTMIVPVHDIVTIHVPTAQPSHAWGHASISSAGRRLHILELRDTPLPCMRMKSIRSHWHKLTARPSHDIADFALLLWGTVLLANLDTLQQGLHQCRGT